MGGPPSLSRRALLGTALAWAIGRPGRGYSEVDARQGSFTARAQILYGALRFEESGVIDERIDRAAGSYEVRISGRGHEMTTDIESTGALRDGRWAPLQFTDRFVVYGRESRLEIVYDYARRAIRYHGRSETFLLRRIRTTDDTVAVPAGVHVDDVVSATLNYAERRWAPEADGRLVTQIIRRRRVPGERPDDAERRYRAEIVPFVLQVGTDAGGRATAAVDMTRFTSWAKEDEPARIVFGTNRRPESITAPLVLGTSLTIRVESGLAVAS